MQIKPASIIACAVSGLLTYGASRAMALSCISPSLTAPEPEAVDVPTNTRVWCSHEFREGSLQVLLTDADGVAVSGTHTRLSTPQYEVLVFRPDSELEPNTEYHVDCPLSYVLGSEEDRREFAFSTGSSSLSKAPPIPNVGTVELAARRGDDWGDSYSASFRQAGEPGSIMVLNLGGSSTLNPAELSGHVADSTYLRSEPDYWVGAGPCRGNWPGAALGASTTVALGAFDLAGGFSGWSETITVTLPSAYTDVPGEASSEESSEPADVPDVLDAPEVTEVGVTEVTGVEGDADDVALSTPTRARSGGAGCQLSASAGSSYGAAALLAALLWRVVRRRAPNIAS